ncbi:MAG: hypothetical protein JW941_06210 [Candidatus Coatesbacteria bacterium]|nr:hypothetical protein [Candidatus Coatesbacteria bacterium]
MAKSSPTIVVHDRMSSEVGESELESPKASPAETLRAYAFFHSEGRVLFGAVFFSLMQILVMFSTLAAFWLGSDTILRIIAPPFLIFSALSLASVLKRNRERRRLRLSLWEKEIKEFCAGPKLVAFSVAAPTVALLFWLGLFIYTLTLL